MGQEEEDKQDEQQQEANSHKQYHLIPFIRTLILSLHKFTTNQKSYLWDREVLLQPAN